jgi:hypothetical protein
LGPEEILGPLLFGGWVFSLVAVFIMDRLTPAWGFVALVWVVVVVWWGVVVC